MSQALISSSVKLVTVLIKEEIQWNDRARRGNLIQQMLLFLTLFHSAKKHLLNYFLFATWSKNTVRYTENYALKKQAASLTLKTCFADDSKQHILIASQAKTSIYPHQWDSGARTGARPGLRESIPALPLFILPRVIYGISRNDCKVVNCVFTPTDNKSDAHIHPLNVSHGFRSTGSTFYTVSNRYLFMVINQNPMTAGLGNWPFLASDDAAQW